MILSSYFKKYDKQSEVKVTNTKIIGYYSIDDNGVYKDDHSELKYIKTKYTNQKGVSIDLNQNFEERTENELYGEGNSMNVIKASARLSPCLKYFDAHRKHLNVFSTTPIRIDEVPFVTGKGTLFLISKHPYEKFEPIRFSVIFANGVIYIRNIDTLKMKRDKEETSERSKLMTSWGYKFEKCIYSDDFDSDPDIFSPVNEVREFDCVISSSIGKHNIIYRSKMDGILIDEHNKKEDITNHEEFIQYLNKQKHVDIRTLKIFDASNDQLRKFGFKCRIWLSQNTFGGIGAVVCGFRNEDGIVTEVKSYETSSLSDHVNAPGLLAPWNLHTCTNFLDSFLTYVKNVLKTKMSEQGYNVGRYGNVRSCPVTRFVLHCEPKGNVFEDKPMPDEDIDILDEWFLNKLEKI